MPEVGINTIMYEAMPAAPDKNLKNWILKNEMGHIQGPFSTRQIIKMIQKGSFGGQEMVSKYPDGQWQSLSRVPEFYDAILDILENPDRIEKFEKMEAETVVISTKQTKTEPLNTSTESSYSRNNSIGTSSSISNKNGPNGTSTQLKNRQSNQSGSKSSAKSSTTSGESQFRQRDDSVIDLENVNQIKSREMKKRTFKVYSENKPLIIGGVIIIAVLGYLFFSDSHSGPTEKIHLLGPKLTNIASLSQSNYQAKMARAIASIEVDTFNSYITAENILVEVVEGLPDALEPRGLLCLVYKELWPFSKQDSKDQLVISNLVKSTKKVNIISPHGQLCEAVRLLTSAREKEARGVIESALETEEKFSLMPAFFYLKAEILRDEKDFLNALPYMERASQMWEKWLAPKVSLGYLYYSLKQFNEAGSTLSSVLKINPSHKSAQLYYGIVLYRGFKNTDRSLNFLKAALSDKTRISRALEAEGYLVGAEIEIEKNHRKAAIELAEKGYSLNPNNLELQQLITRLGGAPRAVKGQRENEELMFLGDQYVRQGDLLAAQAEYKAAFDVNPKNGNAALKAAKCLWELNQSFEAVDWLKKAIKADPALISAYVLQADYLSQRFDFGGAIQVLMGGLKVGRENYEIHRGLALVELRRNNMNGAIAHAQKAVQLYDGDLETFTILSRANLNIALNTPSNNPKEITKKENAQKDAIKYASKAVELDSANPEAQKVFAEVLAATNGVDAGIRYLSDLIKKYSYSLEYRVALAEMYRSEDRFSQAKEIYEQVTEMDPKNKRAFIGLGQSYKALGINEAALKSFLKAAVIDPTDGEALFNAGVLYMEGDRFNEAVDQFKRVQRVNPGYPRTNYYIGKAAFQAGNFKGAQEAATLEKKSNPSMADAYILSAEIYDAQKQYSECAAEYARAIKYRPNSAEIYTRAATCYRQSGSLDVAENMLELASTRENGYADIYKEQGAIYEIRGDSRSAVAAYNKYLGLAPNAKDFGEIEEKTRRLQLGK